MDYRGLRQEVMRAERRSVGVETQKKVERRRGGNGERERSRQKRLEKSKAKTTRSKVEEERREENPCRKPQRSNHGREG